MPRTVVITAFRFRMTGGILDTRLDDASVAICLTVHAGCFAPPMSERNFNNKTASDQTWSGFGSDPSPSYRAEARHSIARATRSGGVDFPDWLLDANVYKLGATAL